jgi:hypothetical protein
MTKTLAALLIAATALAGSPALATKVIEKRDGTVVVRGNDSGIKVRQRANGTLAVRQKGDDRNLGVRQVGGDNALRVGQVGDDTTLRVRQKGDTNVANAEQLGRNPHAEIRQRGSVNDAQLRQGRRRRR